MIENKLNLNDPNYKNTSDGFSLIIPAYNEESAIENVISELKEIINGLEIDNEIIVVNDGSTDQTPDILNGIKGICLINHQTNMGYGSAIKTGLTAAKYNYIGITDADGTYPNEKIPELIAAMNESDMVVGARMGKDAKIPVIRKPAKWILAMVANYLVQQKIPDLNSGLRIFKKEIALKFLNILPDRFSFTTTITLALLSNRYKVNFIPINYHQRIGKSKIRPIRDTMNFLQLIIRTILLFDPLRIFLPVGAGLILTSCCLFVLRLIKGGGFGVTIPMFLLAGIQILAIGMIADLIDRRMKGYP